MIFDPFSWKETDRTRVDQAGTPIPRTTNYMSTLSPNEIQTLQAMPTITIGPTITPKPSKNSTPTPWVHPPPTIPPWDNPGENPYP